MTEVNTPKWYDKTWLVVILCIVFFPVGLYALWMSRTIGKGWKIGGTIVIGLLVLASIGGDDKKKEVAEADALAAPLKELTQAQKDSVARVEAATKDSLAREARVREIEERRNATIESTDLWAAYSNNEVKADEDFKGKKFYVTGTIENIGKVFGDIFVTLEGDGMIMGVQCSIKDKDVVAQLQKGQVITVLGTCTGLTMNVSMDDCVVVENLEDLEAQ